MIHIRSTGEVQKISRACQIVKETLEIIQEMIVPGISTLELDIEEIVSVDVGSLIEGYYGDHAKSFAVGKVNSEKEKLMSVTRECLLDGIDQATPGNRIGDIGHAVQKRAESNGYGVVTELVGHGIGTKLHEDPQIPNYGKPGTGPKIEVGMCFAIEPMINMGTPGVYTKKDGWTVCTKDGMPSAHFEHTITITEDGAKILTI